MGNVTGSGTVYGNTSDPYDPDKWPFDQDFRAFYWPQASNATLPHDECCAGQCILDVAVNSSFGPGYHDGNEGNLIITSTVDNITATLTGTVYIKGDDATLEIGKANRDFYLDLNYQTIYVEGINHDLSQSSNAIYIPPGKVTIIGSGAIIAEGNIDFQPNMEAGSEDEFVFVLSLYGRINFQPNGTLYGSVAAQDVKLGPGNVLTHTDSPTDPETGEQVIDFPLDAVECSVKILTWDINPQ